MTDAELAHTKDLAFWMVERVFMNPISAKLLNEDWRKAFPDEVAVAERMKALVEALEKAQQQNKSDFEIKARLCKESNSLHDRLREAEKRIAELEDAEQKLCAANVTLDARAELAERQLAELESRTVTVKSLTHEVRNALKAEGLADVLKDAAEYAPLTAWQWETLTKNWHQTFIGLSGSAAGIKWEGE
ncbi:hypothetical protein RZQ20_00225 [Raoultella ornithinolytica]|uniref:hypothetical protein n=1 Tax=Raoultella ornithinolytica TaxID=54291 RepID=UPI00292B9830|nr:hypothetical protein [Raoultella ornithinolytica]MDV1090738.1 hypothetical protein [Raoultella ornithinolytica]MDV1119085.1 hypothetical protein [Raoultella ornithinolytica]MDV1889449.1 hypothetical protein [Raoultella ornithinolytica]MEB8022800.1 hypothetical protein [Raoultella ornithinolytica]